MASSSIPARGAALDFIRVNLFDPRDMRVLPLSALGPDNDLNEKIDQYVQRVMADQQAFIYVFGERWGPEQGTTDKIFGPNKGGIITLLNERGLRVDGVAYTREQARNPGWTLKF